MIVQGVESVEKGLLGLVFTLQELNIVDEQNIDVAVGGLEVNGSVVLNRVNEVVGELFRRYVAHLDARVKVQGVVANGVQEVSLTQTWVSIDKQRVVGLSRSFGNRKGGGVGKAVRASGHE